MEDKYLDSKRKSYVKLGEIYFWTATINKWQCLLKEDSFKEIIIQSLEYLSNSQKIDVFAFAIMPNHIHIIWRINANHKKETTVSSFLKFTAHEFLKKLKYENPIELINFRVIANNKLHEFWQRDSLAIPLYTINAALQKLNYTHNNPIVEKWSLATEPQHYKYSTAIFYEKNEKNFPFVKNLMDEF